MYLAVIVAVTLLSFASSAKTGRKVAFNAVFDTNTNVNANQIVVYKYVTVNEGGGYNPSTGIFTAPKGGIYLFQINVMSYENKIAFIHLYKNDVIISTIHLTSGNSYTHAANSAIVTVNKGDTVFVKTYGASFLISSATYHYTTFSGFLI